VTKSNHQIPSSKQIPITNIQKTQPSFYLFFSKILIIPAYRRQGSFGHYLIIGAWSSV